MRNKIITFLYKITTGNKKVRILLTPVGGGAFIVFSLLLILISLLMDDVLNLPKLFPTSFNLLISAPVLISGLFLILWSSMLFAKAKGTPVPFSPPTKLVHTGPYTYIRNPIVLGYILLFFGIGFLMRSISLVLIITPFYFLFLILEIKLIEEPELEKRLGKESLDYKKRVPMFIPKLKMKIKKLM
ncbi:MAG: methyltransferase family protein [Candidatus Hodarchaeales archaeon]|jgi:protein-S-isoprenylcysteine O-methyltransferase Ste14